MEKILRFFTKDKLLVNLITISVICFGLMSMRNIKQEVFPSTDLDTMRIDIVYPGSSATDVELNTVVPIEDELKSITGIDEYVSMAIENGGIIMISLDQDIEDKQKVKDEIFRKISKSNIADIPNEVEDIIITDLNPKLKPVYVVSLTPKDPEKVPAKKLYATAETLDNLLTRIDGVSGVNKKGYLDREIHIDVIPGKMEESYISLNDVVSSIQTRNIRASGGTLQSLHKEKSILTIGQFADPMDVKDVIIRSGFEQRRITIKDIANVEDGFEKETVQVKVNQKKAVVLTIKKNENADIVDTVANIKTFFEENKSLYSEHFDITVVEDDSKSITSLLNVVASNAMIGFFLVLIVLFVFLDFKTSFWTAFSIPFCLLMVIGFMYIIDFSINILTLGAIVTVLGMMVDDAIVIAEVIYEKKKTGMKPLEAAVQGVKEIIGPVTVTILSTIVAFLPMLTISGTMGKFIYVYPVVITATLLASLFEATFILPNHLADDKEPKKESKKEKKKRGDWFIPVMEFYERTLKKALRYRYAVVGIFLVLFIGTIFVSRESIKGFVLMWDDTAEKINVNLEAPRGTSLERTSELTAQIENIVLKEIPKEELVSVYTKVGEQSSKPIEPKGKHENWAVIQIKLVPTTERERSAEQYVAELREKINEKKFPAFDKIVFAVGKMGPPTGSAVDVKIISDNDATAKKIHREVEAYLAGIPGVKDIDHDQKKGKQELKIEFDYRKLAQFGMNVNSVARAVRTAYEGSVATSIQTTANKLDFRVQVDDTFRKDKKFLLNLLVPNNQGRLIRLKEIAVIKPMEGKASINHYNGDRAINVTADTDTAVITPTQAARKLKERFKDIPKKYPGAYIVYGGESKESKKALSGLGVAFIMALIMIYFIVVILFRSLSQPLIVLSVIPFGLIGVLLAYTAHGIPLSFMGIIGIIGLSGVVINDSVIMVNFINTVFKKSGSSEDESIIKNIADGAKQRLRPIMLTTITTVAGLLPTVYGIGGDAQTLVPTVMAMSYGLLFATVLTLIFIPSLYMVNMDAIVLVGKAKTRVKNLMGEA
ncbi:MAG: efflux RND transporter permease subunit [bacterium]|nr:efflux RND transporter permease subunit [bacterium]